MTSLPKLPAGRVPFFEVEPIFDWSADQPGTFMLTADICRAAGFEPTPGDCVSVGRMLVARRGVKAVRYRGQRGLLMPPLRKADEPEPI